MRPPDPDKLGDKQAPKQARAGTCADARCLLSVCAACSLAEGCAGSAWAAYGQERWAKTFTVHTKSGPRWVAPEVRAHGETSALLRGLWAVCHATCLPAQGPLDLQPPGNRGAAADTCPLVPPPCVCCLRLRHRTSSTMTWPSQTPRASPTRGWAGRIRTSSNGRSVLAPFSADSARRSSKSPTANSRRAASGFGRRRPRLSEPRCCGVVCVCVCVCVCKLYMSDVYMHACMHVCMHVRA